MAASDTDSHRATYDHYGRGMISMEDRFPAFGRYLAWRRSNALYEEWEDQMLPAASLAEIAALEAQLPVALPDSYKRFLEIARGVRFWGGGFEMDEGHPFVLDFPPLEGMTWRHKFDIAKRGTGWPPPSQGMLCFAEFWLEGDGDKALFDVHGGLVDGEYPVYYYNHERSEVRALAPSFHEWLERVVTNGH